MRLLAVIVIGLVLGFWSTAHASDQNTRPSDGKDGKRPEIVVYKSPYCGCCAGWADHMEAEGYTVTTHNVDDLEPIKQKAGVPDELMSCHTATVDGYVIEGHVPASAIDRLLSGRPLVKGLAVPGMPIGSPGMEGADPEAYDVMSFDANGRSSVFISMPASK